MGWGGGEWVVWCGVRVTVTVTYHVADHEARGQIPSHWEHAFGPVGRDARPGTRTDACGGGGGHGDAGVLSELLHQHGAAVGVHLHACSV